MLKMLWGWIKKLVWIELEADTPKIETKQEEVPKYKVPDSWVHPGPPPTNTAIHKLYQGMETHGDHIFYRDPDTGSISGGLTDGKKMWNVRLVIFWLDEKKLDPSRELRKIEDHCNTHRCVRPGHLRPAYEPLDEAHTGTNLPVSNDSAPPVYKPRTIKRKGPKEQKYNDRTRCVSSKIWFPTKELAQKEATDYNNNRRPKGGRRLFGYDCDWCDGSHLTKHDPKKRTEYKYAGSW